MQTKRFDGVAVRMVLIGMVTDQVLLSRVASQWNRDGLFDSKWANLIGTWCVEHFVRYQTPPRNRITRIFELWAAKPIADEKTVSAIESFLLVLSDDRSEYLTDQLLDVAEKYFNEVRMRLEIEQVRLELENGLVSEASARMQDCRKINLRQSNYINASKDVDAWFAALHSEDQRPLVRYPGDLGEFTQGVFIRGAFFSFVAPDKTGKSTYLRDFMYRAVRQRNRIAFFDLGDSNEKEVLAKLAHRASFTPRYESILKIPTDWNAENQPVLMEMPFSAVDAGNAFARFSKICKDDDVYRISCHKNSTLTVQELDGILGGWAQEGFRPDVVGVDYADILANPRGVKDKLEAISENWKGLRRISQARDVLLMTATQSKATGYTKTENLLGPEDFSGNKEKNAHVNGMLGINVSSKEKMVGAGRLNWCVRREGESNSRWCCRVAGHFAIGNPAIISKMA